MKILIINKDVKKIFDIVNFINDTYTNSICYYSTLLSTLYDENLSDIDILIITLNNKNILSNYDIEYINKKKFNLVIILEDNINLKLNELKNVYLLNEPFTFLELKNNLNNIKNKLKK